MERAIPYIIQLPGINPTPLGKKYGDLLDLDIEQLYADGMPSITALNSMMAKGAGASGAQSTGNPETDPAQQGDRGSQNAQDAQRNEPGPQPGYTPPAA